MHRCRSDILELIPADQAQLVEWLAVPHQSAYAIRKLKQLGSRAVPSLRHGLQHPEHLVRVGCCIALDHVYDDPCLPGLIENLNLPHPDVRTWALHALQQAHRSDNHPAVRKVCSWWVPGGTCFVKSLP